MSKKLLNEAQVRRFAKLASLPAVNERYGTGKDQYRREKVDGEETRAGEGPKGHYKDFMKEQEDDFEEIAAAGEEAGMGDLPPGEEAGLEDLAGEEEAGLEDMAGDEVEAGMDLGSREEIAMDVIAAVADALNIEVDIEGGEEFAGEEEMPLEDEEELEAPPEGEEELEFEDEEAIMEALRGIDYLPGKKEIVNEVAKRVAKRLLKAKQAEKQLKEALGNGPRRTPRRTAKTTATRQPTRSTRNARRRTKK